MTATPATPTHAPTTVVVNGEELPVPIKGNSALAYRVRAGLSTEEWALPSATTAEVYTVKRCTRTGRILHSTCPCWKFNPQRDVEDCAHTAAVAEAAKLAELIAIYSGPTWTLAALQVEDARLRAQLAAEDSRLIRLQWTALGTVILARLCSTQEAA